MTGERQRGFDEHHGVVEQRKEWMVAMGDATMARGVVAWVGRGDRRGWLVAMTTLLAEEERKEWATVGGLGQGEVEVTTVCRGGRSGQQQ
ncbi:hypothetical protein BHM03_00008638 [Ensete ventricosum]|nr:hypothetical protein BHM03_00008638 [Ensete ventricosum]